MPVAAVTLAGRPRVSSGSANTARARSCGEKTIFFTCVSSSEMTALRPTSLPVPAVVGRATQYGNVPQSMGRASGRPSSYSNRSRRDGWP